MPTILYISRWLSDIVIPHGRLNLADRDHINLLDNMRFPMPHARTAMNGRIQIDPSSSYLLGRKRDLEKQI